MPDRGGDAQPGWLVRKIVDDAARDRLADNIVAQLPNGVTEQVLHRAFGYLRDVNQSLDDRGERDVRRVIRGSA